MPAPQRQTATTFRSGNAASAHARQPAAVPHETAVPSPSRTRTPVQTGWLAFIVLGAVGVVLIGMAYLSGYAQLKAAQNNQHDLTRTLKQEKEKWQYWSERRANAIKPAMIEARARELGMVPVDEKKTYTVK